MLNSKQDENTWEEMKYEINLNFWRLGQVDSGVQKIQLCADGDQKGFSKARIYTPRSYLFQKHRAFFDGFLRKKGLVVWLSWEAVKSNAQKWYVNIVALYLNHKLFVYLTVKIEEVLPKIDAMLRRDHNSWNYCEMVKQCCNHETTFRWFWPPPFVHFYFSLGAAILN